MAALLTVLCLATVCWGALGQDTTSMPAPSPSMSMPPSSMMVASSSSMMMVMVSSSVLPAPTMAVFTPVGTEMMFNAAVSARTAAELNDVYNVSTGFMGVSRFDNSLSSTIRREYYFNCVEKDMNGDTTFPTTTSLTGNVFSIYFQMPVLFYLNFEVRRGLMDALRRATTSTNLCIYRHQDFRVSYFEEGVLLSIFDVDTVRGTAATPLNGEMLQTNFMANRGGVPGYTNFLGKPAFNLATADLYMDGVIPAVLAPRSGDDAGFATDPGAVRRHALMIRSYLGSPDLFGIASDIQSNAASNPNAINFYLEAGDYVFIVIGSILCFSVLLLAVIGYAIHPYFLG